MPTTYNGIGTHYYGKRNVEKRQGTCQQCGRNVELTSYDTRLWFVFVFIPIFPLGRKRIIDQCPACTRHYVLDLHKWETAKQLEISGALDKFRSDSSPESAIEAHQALIRFHQSSQAAEFRQMMRTKFADNAKVQAYLGAVCEHLGQLDEALPYFTRAFELRPDLPDARVGVAEGHIRGGRLDEARPLLDFLEKPGAAQLYSLGPLETLALAFQKEGRHTEALDVFNKILTELPHLAEHTGFRKMIERSEKALGKTSSALPKRRFSWRRLFGNDPTAPQAGAQFTWKGAVVLGVILLLVLLGFLAWNEYTRRHRTVYIVNTSTPRTEVEITGVGQMRANPGITQMTVPEGRHHLIVRGPEPAEFDVDISSGYFERWGDSPAWVLNIGRNAIFVLTTATYSKNPQPATFNFFFGERFYNFPDVSHVFRPLPETMQIKSGEQRTARQLDVYRDPPVGLFQYLQHSGRMADAQHLAEWQLRRHPDDEDMLRVYASAAGGRKDEAEKFLRAALTNRPVQIEWHRAYQSLQRDRARDARLAGEYEALLQAEPNNSALLYLRGRVSPNRQEARRYFERAIAADGSNPFPYYALGYERISGGDWEGARQALSRAAALRPKDASFARYLGMARLAMGEYQDLEREYRARLKKDPADFFGAVFLCEVLTAAGKTNDVRDVTLSFERFSPSRHGDNAREMITFLRRHVLYLMGDFAGLERFGTADRTPAGNAVLFQALLEQGRVADALRVRSADAAAADDPFQALTISLAWNLAGKLTEARDWRERAARGLDKGDNDFVRAAALLRSATAPSREELDSVVLPSDAKALLLAVMAQQYPDRRTELAAASRRLNVERNFPYYLIQRATAQ